MATVRTDATRRPLRSRWSHRSSVHRAVVRTANHVLQHVPFELKYAATDQLRRKKLPYSLVGPAAVVVQVGAPCDTLHAGRSRAMTFARRVGPTGRVLVVEPDATSAEAFTTLATERGLRQVEVRQAAAWSEPSVLQLEVDARHPATNFVAGAADYGDDELRRFRKVRVDACPLDDLLEQAGLHRVDLVSITTNGAERQILEGLGRTIRRGLPYLCLAGTAASYTAEMDDLGYDFLGHDDRGFTFRQREGEAR